MKNQAVISTIGTSLLTNQIDRSSPAEKHWYSQLRDTANSTLEQTPPEVAEIIRTLSHRAQQKLEQSSTSQIRAASAELNGIYGLYQEQLDRGKADIHWLIATDTAQGSVTAKIVEVFLHHQGLSAQTYTPKGLSTASTASFADGIDDLLTQLQGMIEGYEKVCFNLVGGFKSLQAYLNTIGMFYADELIYIFEGANSDVIKIPRLPIKIDESVIQPYVVQFALMAAGAEVQRSQLEGVQETLVYALEDEATLSNWGRLIWNQAKADLLFDELLAFPYLEYQPSFVNDYRSIRNKGDRVKLQETLAKVSQLLLKHQGNVAALKRDGGVQLETYHNTNIDHFRVNLSLRVSCKTANGALSLRYYGTHDHVERSEGI